MRRRIKRLRLLRAEPILARLQPRVLAAGRRAVAPTARAVAGTFIGGVAIAAGVAMIFPAAGLIVGGAELVFYCLRVADVDPKGR